MNDKVTEKIIGAAIEVHRILGPGLLELIYEEALCHEFHLRNIHYERQVDVVVNYKNCTIRGQRLDLIISKEIVVEIKSVRRLPEASMAQILSYLKASELKRGLLINFGEKRLVDGIKRISL